LVPAFCCVLAFEIILKLLRFEPVCLDDQGPVRSLSSLDWILGAYSELEPVTFGIVYYRFGFKFEQLRISIKRLLWIWGFRFARGSRASVSYSFRVWTSSLVM
jgi:hypothetical protein